MKKQTCEIDTLITNGEMVIPKVDAEQIGQDRLEKINNRGKEKVDEIEKEEQAKQEQVQGNPQAQGMMGVQMGGQIALDENKNQPIAVPRESFAGQSTVGRKLLSPMSPESQDDEAELENKSQSYIQNRYHSHSTFGLINKAPTPSKNPEYSSSYFMVHPAASYSADISSAIALCAHFPDP